MAEKAIPKDRRVRCKGEYEKLKRAWRTLLEPHRRSEADQKRYREARTAIEAKTPVKNADEEGCGKAIEHITQLMVDRMVVELKGLKPDEIDAAAEHHKQSITSIVEDVMMSCLMEPWSKRRITCMKEVSSLDDASRCKKL